MLLSKLLGVNAPDTPAAGGSETFRLLARAAIARRVGSGIYALLPLGARVARKLVEPLRRRLEEDGAQEVFLPALLPAELWERSSKLPPGAGEIFRARDAEDRRFCVGPGAREPVMSLASGCLASYRQLPVTLYRLGERSRDRGRTSAGLGDARSPVVLEALWFGLGQASLDRAARAVEEIFADFLEDCGLNCRLVRRPPREGVPGASSLVVSHVPGAPDFFVECPACGFLRRSECRQARRPADLKTALPASEEPKPLEKIHTPGVRTIEDLVRLVGESPARMTKILFYQAMTAPGEPRLVAALVGGDQELSEAALREYLGADYLALARPQDVLTQLAVPVGSAGPVGLRGVEIIADRAVVSRPNLISGANEEDYHFRHVNYPRDFQVSALGEFAVLAPSGPCPGCGGQLDGWEGMEVARVEEVRPELVHAFHCVVGGAEGEQQVLSIGHSWLDVWRVIEGVACRHRDEDGLGWPVWLAPYQAVVIPVGRWQGEFREAAVAVYGELRRAGIEVALDDREERPGVKFKDVDLVGFPYAVVITPEMVRTGTVEIKPRRQRRGQPVPRGELVARIVSLLEEEKVRRHAGENGRSDGG